MIVAQSVTSHNHQASKDSFTSPHLLVAYPISNSLSAWDEALASTL
jgi:hypothetical protein